MYAYILLLAHQALYPEMQELPSFGRAPWLLFGVHRDSRIMTWVASSLAEVTGQAKLFPATVLIDAAHHTSLSMVFVPGSGQLASIMGRSEPTASTLTRESSEAEVTCQGRKDGVEPRGQGQP